MLADIADAGRAVRFEQKGENLTYEIGIYFALSHIFTTLGARMVTLSLDA